MGAPVVVFLVAFGAYATTASPVAGWLDSAEFVAASVTLGVPHSPGHPLPVLLGKAAQVLVPFGDAPFRVNLASAIAGATAAALLAWIVRDLVARVAPSLTALAAEALAAGAALGVAFTWAAWTQAVRAEVYALEAALLFGALAAVLQHDATRDPRALATAAFAAGLALANHHFVTILFALPAAAVALARRPRARVVGVAALLAALGLAAFLYLPVRAARDPLPNWGDPRTLDRFAWTVSARAFQKSLAPTDGESRAGEAAQVGGALLEQLGPGLALAALAGAYLLLRRRETRRPGLLLIGIAACVAAGPAALGFDADNPDAHGYLLPALAALAALAAAGVAIVSGDAAAAMPGRTGARAVGLAAAALVVALAAVQGARHARSASLRHGHAPERWAGTLLDGLPSRTVLVTSYYETAFQLWALRAVEAARPDVTHLDRSFLTYPGFAASARRRHPELAALIDAPLRAGAPTPLARLPRDRPVAFELHMNLEAAVLPYLAPDGPVAWWFPSPPPPEARAVVEARDARRSAALAAALASPVPAEAAGARRVLTWNAFLRARAYCALGRARAAGDALALARRLDPDDPALDELERACPAAAEAP